MTGYLKSNPTSSTLLEFSGIIGIVANVNDLRVNLSAFQNRYNQHLAIPTALQLLIAGDIAQIAASGAVFFGGGEELGALALGTAGTISLLSTAFNAAGTLSADHPDDQSAATEAKSLNDLVAV